MCNLLNMKIYYLIAVFIVGLFAYFVWPTMYWHDYVVLASRTLPIKVNRFTDETYMFTPQDGWVKSGRQ